MEEQKNVESGAQENDVISPSALNDVLKNYVPRSTHEKLKKDYNEVVNNILEGKEVQVEQKKEAVNIQEIRDKLLAPNSGLKACEYIENVLALREAHLEKTGQDIFVPNYSKASVSLEDRQDAEEVAEFFKDWLEKANGSDDDFVREIKNNVVEMAPLSGVKGNSNNRRR